MHPYLLLLYLGETFTLNANELIDMPTNAWLTVYVNSKLLQRMHD